MKVAVIYNKRNIETSDVIQVFGMPTKEQYNPKTVDRVAKALEEGGHNVRIIEGNMHVVEEMRHFMPRVLAGERPGIVFNMAYGIQGQSRYTHIPAMLEMLGVPYVGSGPAVHGIALDKVMTKIVLQQRNLPTPGFWVFSSHKDPCDDVIYPVIVKPKMEAVSMGLRVVHEENDLRDAVKNIIEEFNQQALVEQFIPGREFAVGLLGNYPNPQVLPIVEIDLRGDPNAIQSFSDKTQKPPEKICPPDLPQETADEMKRLAREAFYALGIFDFARVDFRMDSEGRIYILELNSMASLGLTGSYFHSAKVAKYTYSTMVNRMLDVAAVRYFGEPEKIAEEQQPEKTQTISNQIRSYLRSNHSTMEDFLSKMLETNTYVHNVEGVNALGNWMTNRLAQLGFQSQVHPQVEVGNTLYFTNHQDEENDILILGHLDIFYKYQDYVPLREERGRLYGSGVAESKGGLAILLGALQSLRFARRLRSARCGILLTTDDSLGGRFSEKLVEEKARRSKFVVGLKCGETDGGIVTSCSGRATYRIEITNVKGASSNGFPDVIPAVCQKLLAWQKLSSPEEGVAVNSDLLEARSVYGPAPDHAMASLVARFKTREQGEELDKQIRRIAKRDASRNLRVQVIRSIYRTPSLETETSKSFFERVQRVAKRLDVRVQPAHRFSSSDICYVPDEIPSLEGMGPVGGGYRSPNEYILRDTVIDRAALLALTIRACAREEKK